MNARWLGSVQALIDSLSTLPQCGNPHRVIEGLREGSTRPAGAIRKRRHHHSRLRDLIWDEVVTSRCMTPARVTPARRRGADGRATRRGRMSSESRISGVSKFGWALTIMAGLGLAACSGDGTDSSTPTVPAQVTPTQESATVTPSAEPITLEDALDAISADCAKPMSVQSDCLWKGVTYSVETTDDWKGMAKLRSQGVRSGLHQHRVPHRHGWGDVDRVGRLQRGHPGTRGRSAGRGPGRPDPRVLPGLRVGVTQTVTQRDPLRSGRVSDLERTTGFEPATPTLARWCSTN